LLDPKNYQIFLKVRPILDIDPIITFYILVEPYKLSGEYMVSDDVFNQRLFDAILKAINVFNDPASEYKKILNTPIEEPCAVFNNTKSVIESINNLRIKLLNDIEVRTLPEEILNIYNYIENKNELKTLSSNIHPIINLFPETLFIHYQNNHNKRLWQDEYRFIIGECIRTMNMELDPSDKEIVWNTLCNSLKLNLRGDDYSNELCIMNNSSYPLTAYIKDKVKMMQYFVNSPDFLFMGCNLELFCGIISPIETNNGTKRHKIAEASLNKQTHKHTHPDFLHMENVLLNMPHESKEHLLNKLQKSIEDNKEIKGNAHDEYLESINEED